MERELISLRDTVEEQRKLIEKQDDFLKMLCGTVGDLKDLALGVSSYFRFKEDI